MIDFTTLQGLTIPEGNVKSISRNGVLIWEKGGSPGQPDTPSFTNLLPISEAIDSTAPYNDTGYKMGKYLGSSSPFESSGAATDWMTGCIPYTGVGSIYVKGVAWTSASHNRLYSFSSKTARVAPGITGSGGTLTTYFTYEELGENYWKLTPIESKYPQSGTTVNYIRFCFASGTPSNVIITIDEPIE